MYILFWVYESACMLLPFAAVLALTRRGRTESLLPVWLFALFAAGVFRVTGAGTLYDFLRMGFDRYFLTVNVVPFSEEISVMGYALNAMMLMPFGFLTPLIWKETDKLGRIAFAGFSFSLLIELSQLLNHRASDVDDLLLNTLGAVLGFALFRLYARVSRRPPSPPSGRRWQWALYLLVIFLGRFLLFNGMGLAMLLHPQ